MAGVFTKSKTASAPVDWCKANLKTGAARALVVNSGNANAFTGKAGFEGARRVAESAAAVVGCRPGEVFMASTGVIGEPLPARRSPSVLGALAEEGAADGWRAAAEAIMTTDTYPKMATASAMIDGKRVTINGIAKGSGMIAPGHGDDAFLRVHGRESARGRCCRNCCRQRVKPSFNAITVDSDTSTSDTLLLFATGKGAHHAAITKASDKRLNEFRQRLDAVLLNLALQVVRDGEGAQKLIRIDVTGAESDDAAKRIALSVANSPLVKTAIAGEDANWGRVVMAVGKSGEAADRDKLKIAFGSQVVAEKGERAAEVQRSGRNQSGEGPRGRDQHRHRPRQRQGSRLDLRSHARIYRHQWQLQKLNSAR